MRIYVSHAVRGVLPLGLGESLQERCEANNRIAIQLGKELREYWPEVDWYIPGEHDTFPIAAMGLELLTVDQVLDIDCEIISKCDALFPVRWEPGPSEGMVREWEFAKSHNIPIIATCLDDPSTTLVVNPEDGNKRGWFLWPSTIDTANDLLDEVKEKNTYVVPDYLRRFPFPIS